MLLAGGAEKPRDLEVPGRELRGIHFAMDFLVQQNRRGAGERIDSAKEILATGKRIAIIGGGDTGADCLGTCHRQRALSVHQLEILPAPPVERSPETPWPLWPLQLRVESSHEEGGIREWGVSTIRFEGDEHGNVARLVAVRVGPPPGFDPIPDSEFSLDVDMVILALGFTGTEPNGMLEQLGVRLDPRGRVEAGDDYMTSVPGIFAAGDMRRGQSLIVWAIDEGRRAADAIHRYLRQSSAREVR
jgi:glutamate synthase (NADPH/NADH) small chain